MAKLPDLADAYALSSPDGMKQLYADWAHSYDTGFGEAMGYQLPRNVARAFVAAGGVGPVLDFGAGTGLVAAHLAGFGIGPIDAVDVSAEMLGVARGKSIYRDLMTDDIFKPTSRLAPSSYTGVVSAGTFTHGHVGPDGLRPLLDLLVSGGVAVLSVNAAHFDAMVFCDEIAKLEPHLAGSAIQDVRIYDDRADAAHRNDLARLVILHKA